jgi:fructose-1,6-bisphosphatase I
VTVHGRCSRLSFGASVDNTSEVLDRSKNCCAVAYAPTVGEGCSVTRKALAYVSLALAAAVLQPGMEQLAAGYVVYGSSTIMVYTTGHGVHGFTLDPSIGAYVLSHENIRMPEQGTYYSSNDAYWEEFPIPYRDYLTHLRNGGMGRHYSLRYIGSLVADFHRTLLRGGVFLYPPTRSNPEGKLRLLYEANPVAFIAEQAGGVASDGERRVLEVQPTDIHQRTPLIVGSKSEMEEFEQFVQPAEVARSA